MASKPVYKTLQAVASLYERDTFICNLETIYKPYKSHATQNRE